MKALSAALALLWFTCTVAAQGAQDEPKYWCRNGAFPTENAFQLAQVTGASGARTYFFSDEEGCPNAGAAKCQQKSYVLPGDQVIVSRRYGAWLCGWYQPARGHETVGWLPADSLRVTDVDTSPALERWLGAWGFYEQSLEISRAKPAGELRVKGTALWHGLGDNVHVGEVDQQAKPQGNELLLTDGEEYGCKLRLRLVGSYIVASDNLQCGGANVTFNGVYQRAPAPKRRTKRNK